MSTTSGYRFLAVSLTDQYQQKRIVADVWACDPDGNDARRESGWHGRFQTGPFSSQEIEHLELSAYVGHYTSERYPSDRPPGEVWGWEVEMKPFSVRVRDVDRLSRVLKALDRRTRKLDDEEGAPLSYAAWLVRLGKILGCTRIRIFIPNGQGADLGPPWRLTEGAAEVERIAVVWGTGTRLYDACRERA